MKVHEMTTEPMHRRALLVALLTTGSASLFTSTSAVAQAPRELKWSDLIPPGAAPPKRAPFFAGAQPKADPTAAGHAAGQPDGKFMSMKSQQPGVGAPPAVVTELDGKRIRIGGYVVPLDFESTTVKEFLLVPFVGACIHVPPPPANQIVYVKSAKGLVLNNTFDPVSVIGTMKTEVAVTGLADAGYSVTAEAVELLKP